MLAAASVESATPSQYERHNATRTGLANTDPLPELLTSVRSMMLEIQAPSEDASGCAAYPDRTYGGEEPNWNMPESLSFGIFRIFRKQYSYGDWPCYRHALCPLSDSIGYEQVGQELRQIRGTIRLNRISKNKRLKIKDAVFAAFR